MSRTKGGETKGRLPPGNERRPDNYQHAVLPLPLVSKDSYRLQRWGSVRSTAISGRVLCGLGTPMYTKNHTERSTEGGYYGCNYSEQDLLGDLGAYWCRHVRRPARPLVLTNPKLWSHTPTSVSRGPSLVAQPTKQWFTRDGVADRRGTRLLGGMILRRQPHP